MKAIFRIQALLFSPLILFSLFPCNSVFAETKTFIKEYTFHAGDEDSKNSSRVIALREVKRLLLEELGTYLESTTEVQNFKLTKDQIVTLTAGIVQTELVEERWDGKSYWLLAKITTDSASVIKNIDMLRKDRQKTKELYEIRKRSDELLKENESLRKRLSTATGKRKKMDTVAYQKTIKELNFAEWFEIGLQTGIAEKWQMAHDAFTRAIELSQDNAYAYYNRGITSGKLGNHNEEIIDYNKALALNPKSQIYYNRGIANAQLGKNTKAIEDFNQAIELNPKDSDSYLNRGVIYANLGNYRQSIADLNMCYRVEPKR